MAARFLTSAPRRTRRLALALCRHRPWSPAVQRGLSTSLPRLPILEAISRHDPESLAIVHNSSGESFKYGRLLRDVGQMKDRLADAADGKVQGERVAFLVENSYDYVVTLLASMAARAIALPLSPGFPASEHQYILNQSQATLLVSSAKHRAEASKVLETELESNPRHLALDSDRQHAPSADGISWEQDGAGQAGMMLYTSGTTNRPKGVLLPEAALAAQCNSLIKAWEYSPQDYLLHLLPLHHIHGAVNALLTPLVAGSTVEFLYPFNTDRVWSRLAAPFTKQQQGNSPTPKPVTFLTAVPTVYSRLLQSHKSLPEALQSPSREAISPKNMRLTISGSAALPTPVKKAWHDLSHGSVLLERYGMTEVGMALSCGLDPSDRVDASVGWALPSVQARLVDTDTGEVIQDDFDDPPQREQDERQGEIQLRGPTIFKEYWRNPEATAAEFVTDEQGHRWFRTGDIAIRRPPSADITQAQDWTKGPLYYIQGRKSADIIKTGGEKVSALEVERELLSLDEVLEAAVVAVPSGKWGHKVGAVLVLDKSIAGSWTPMSMRRALKSRLANYKIPQVMEVVDSIPRNAMGKINKKELVKSLFPTESSGKEQ